MTSIVMSFKFLKIYIIQIAPQKKGNLFLNLFEKSDCFMFIELLLVQDI